MYVLFFFQAEDGIRALVRSRGLGDVYKRQVFVSVRDADKPRVEVVAEELLRRGYSMVATAGTCDYLRSRGFPCERINKVLDGRPHIGDAIKNGEIVFIINTTEGKQAIRESNEIRREAVHRRVTYYTTLNGAMATCEALDHIDEVEVHSLQELHQEAHA